MGLKDFYYFFTATPSRCRRNVLVGPTHVNFVRHLQCFDEGLHGRERWAYRDLATVAMGDSAVVELAQTAHLGIALLQRDIAVPSEILTMSRQLPRQDTFYGMTTSSRLVKFRETGHQTSHLLILSHGR